MKLGLENRREVLIAAALFVLTVFVVWNYIRKPTESTAAATTTASQARPSSAAATPRPGGRKSPIEVPGARSLDPTLRFDWLRSSEAKEYTGGKRNIFTAHSEPPPPKDEHLAKGPKCPGDPGCPPPPPVCPGPDPRCPPPPIALKFFGFANKPGEPKKIFLASGDDVFIAGEGEMVLKRYRVVKINNTSVEIEDVLNNNKQTIPLSSG